jgi:hypothetical protein
LFVSRRKGVLTMIITERQEEVLSWLCGMAPIGETFAYERQHAAVDLGMNNPSVFNHAVNRLADVGAVAVESRGLHGIPSRMTVLKRPEDFSFFSTKRKFPFAGQQRI